MSLIKSNIIGMLILSLLLGLQGMRAGVIPICGTCQVKTIHEGVALAKDQDTLLIRQGLYQEFNILIDKPLTLIGEDYPVVDGQEKGEIFRIVSDSVSLQGFSIVNVGVSYTSDHSAIRVVRSKDFHIENNRFENLFFGIFIEKSSRGIIRDNHIKGVARDEYNSGNGIHLWYSQNIEVS